MTTLTQEYYSPHNQKHCLSKYITDNLQNKQSFSPFGHIDFQQGQVIDTQLSSSSSSSSPKLFHTENNLHWLQTLFATQPSIACTYWLALSLLQPYY